MMRTSTLLPSAAIHRRRPPSRSAATGPGRNAGVLRGARRNTRSCLGSTPTASA